MPPGLAGSRTFKQLPPKALLDIVTSGRVRRFPAGATIFLEGEPCAGMHVLFSGCVHMCKPGSGGQEQIVGVIEPVIMFNEVAVLDGGPNPVTAVAARDCVTWSVSYDAFHALVNRYPVLGLSLLRVLAARNRALILRCEDLSYRSVPARLAKLLLSLSLDGTVPIPRREHSIHQLSALIGTVPELVSRSLASLRAAGMVTLSRKEIIVCDREALARAAHIEGSCGQPGPVRPVQ